MPTSGHRFPFVLDSNLKLRPGLPPPQSLLEPAAHSHDTFLPRIGPLPREALLLGVAEDHLPVLLNLHDPTPGPILIVGETGSGKTSFLKSIAQTLMYTHQRQDVQFGVVTRTPAQWQDLESDGRQVGVFSIAETGAQDLILSLASWAHTTRNTRQSVLLLVDDLEAVGRLDFDTLQNLRWLLARGPSRRVWPFIALDADRYGQVLSWIPIFRTRLFGRIRNGRLAEALSGDSASGLERLYAPDQFSLRENGSWIKFRVSGARFPMSTP